MVAAGMMAALLACVLLSAGFPDPLIQRGFEHFYNLEYDEAIAAFRQYVARQPEEPRGYNHLAQSILYREMYRTGALETELVSGNNPFLRRPKMNPSPEDQKEFDDAIRRAMELSQARLKQNPRDTQALYTLGVAHGLRANYNFLVRKAWMDALRDATQARKLHNRVTELDPNFTDARLVQGVHEYVVGSLPWHWRTLGFLIGFRGNKETGIKILQQVAEKGDVNKLDAKVLLCAIYRRERKPELAIPLIQELIAAYPRNYLLYFELAQMYSDAGEKGQALEVLARLEALRSSGAPGFGRVVLEKIYFARGNIQFWYRDLDEALENIRKAAAHADHLDLNTGVLALMRLGQIYDLKGRRQEAIQAYRQAIAYAPESDAAKESRRYLNTPYRRADIPG
jgi:tetratricopeptide (TPR) repeat protein